MDKFAFLRLLHMPVEIRLDPQAMLLQPQAIQNDVPHGPYGHGDI